MKAKKNYVDISKWTTIMSRRNAGQFLEVSDHLLKVGILMRAYVVPPYGIRWEGKRKKCYKIFFKDSHHDMQIMSRRNAE